jgi:iron-sulfur cluster assembly protein
VKLSRERHIGALEGDPVITVSANAAAAIRQIVTQPGIPAGSGLRIAADDNRDSFHMSVSPSPHPGDTVLDTVDDAPLFLSAEAGELLSDKVIDAEVNDAGQLRFILESTNG